MTTWVAGDPASSLGTKRGIRSLSYCRRKMSPSGLSLTEARESDRWLLTRGREKKKKKEEEEEEEGWKNCEAKRIPLRETAPVTSRLDNSVYREFIRFSPVALAIRNEHRDSQSADIK